MNDYSEKIMSAYKAGEINSYMAERLMKATEFGMTDQLLDDAMDDAKKSSDFGVESDRDHNLKFFILHFSDDMLDDTFGIKLEPDDKDEMCRYMLNFKDDDKYNFKDLTDFRVLMHKWLSRKHNKKAYPNTMGRTERDPVYDRIKWANTIKIIYSLVKEKNIDKESAIKFSTLDWDSDEIYKFTNWLRYYESGNTEKYNVKTADIQKDALDINLPSYLLDPNTRSNKLPSQLQPLEEQEQQKTRKEEMLDQAKKYRFKMKSRLLSLKRLVNKYNDVLPHQDIALILDEMHALEKSFSKLNIYASMQDCTVRAANRIRKIGFSEAADFLIKCAQETLLESLPEATTDKPGEAPGKPAVNVNAIVDRLEGVSKKLKSRDTIRELASIDILLNEMGMASYFPEITDAQAKLIEAYGYSSNKIESIVAKLRGTGGNIETKPSVQKNTTAPEIQPMLPPTEELVLPPPPAKPTEEPINTDELRSKPVGEVKKTLPTR